MAEPSTGAPGRDESADERLDRNWGELLQELRVTQTGIQILFGFLLTLPFTSRFAELGTTDRTLYLVVFGLVALATACNLAPVIAHRVLFRHQQKEWLTRSGNQFAKAALVCLGLALVVATTFVVSLVVNTTVGWVTGTVFLVLLAVLWGVLPAHAFRRSRRGIDDTTEQD